MKDNTFANIDFTIGAMFITIVIFSQHFFNRNIYTSVFSFLLKFYNNILVWMVWKYYEILLQILKKKKEIPN